MIFKILKSSESRWTAANLVSYSRILVTPFFLVLFFREELWAKWAAGLLFAWGAFSDYLDGYLAKHYELRSTFGSLLDPLADKVLFLTIFVTFVITGLAPLWMVVIIAAREFLITGLRQVALGKGIVIAASRGGKHKTVSQIIAISVILAVVCTQATVEKYQGRWDLVVVRLGKPGEWLDHFVWYGPYWMMFYATVMSIISGLDYFFKNRNVLKADPPSAKFR